MKAESSWNGALIRPPMPADSLKSGTPSIPERVMPNVLSVTVIYAPEILSRMIAASRFYW
jgi:hypothetical protein